MKALSIRQPWAELILQGKKKIEIRKWNTKFRGYFLIHASTKLERREKLAIRKYKFDEKKLPLGFIVGYAKLVDVVVYRTLDEFLEDKDKHLLTSIEGIAKRFPVYGFIIEDPRRLTKPIKYRGKLRLFNVPEIDINRELIENP